MVEVGMTMLSLSLILDGFKSALRQVTSWHAPSNARCCTGHPSSFPLLQKPTSMGSGTHSQLPDSASESPGLQPGFNTPLSAFSYNHEQAEGCLDHKLQKRRLH